MKPRNLALASGVMALTACAAVDPNPNAAYRIPDELKSCAFIQAEISENEAYVARLRVPWAYMDTEDSERLEADALRERNRTLRAVADLRDCASQVAATDGFWIGQGAWDSCGESWSTEVVVDVGEVTGKLWRGEVEYDLVGRVNDSGKLEAGRAQKGLVSQGFGGFKRLRFDLQFNGESAAGSFFVDSPNGRYCDTTIVISKKPSSPALAAQTGRVDSAE